MLKLSRAAAAAGLLLAGTQTAAAEAPRIEDIRVQLFYERSGKLSDDLTKRKTLALWNTMIGEGDAKEPADSFLVAVAVRGAPESFDKAAALTITVTADKRKAKVAEKSYNGLLFGTEGLVWKAILVNDRVCTPLTVTAKLKSGSTRSFNLPFNCGE